MNEKDFTKHRYNNTDHFISTNEISKFRNQEKKINRKKGYEITMNERMSGVCEEMTVLG